MVIFHSYVKLPEGMVCQPNLLKFSGETVKLQKRLINSDVIFLEATLNVNRTIYHMSVHVVFGTWIWCSSRERWICILHLAFTSKKTIERAIWDTAKVKAIWDNPYIKTTSTVSLMFCHHVWTWGANHMRSPSLSRPLVTFLASVSCESTPATFDWVKAPGRR